MLLSLVYFAVRRLLGLPTRGDERDDVAREIEILLLRHQLRVLTRGRRMPLRHRDRSCWPRPLSSRGGIAGTRSRSHRRRCCAGIATWCGAIGPTDAGGERGGHGSAARPPRSSCVWPRKTRAGAIVACRVSCVSSASSSRPRRSAQCCFATVLHPPHDEWDPRGTSSWPPRPAAS